MKPSIVLFAYFISSFVFSQHSERFLELTKNLKSTDTSMVEVYYKNGTIREKGMNLAYKLPEYTYHKKFGIYKTYYKEGVLKSEITYDEFGNPLEAVFYNKNGTTWWKSKTLEIDTPLEDPNRFFTTLNPATIIKWDKELKYGSGIGKMYIKTEGKLKNGKKVGLWKVYDEDGRLEEEIHYDSK